MTDKGLGRSSMIMAAGTAVSRALGFVRNILLVGAIGGTGLAADSFDIANKIPNMLFAILAGGVLNAILVPQIVRAYQGRDPERYVNKLLTVATLAIGAMTVALTAASGIVIAVMSGPNWTEAQRALAVTFALWCIPQLFFYGLYTLWGQVLNARRQFGPFMWAPVLNNIVSIAGFAIFIAIFGGYAVDGWADDPARWSGPRIAVLAGTATVGVASQALILLWPLMRGGFRFSFQPDPRGVGLGSAGKVAAWTLAAVLLDQIGVVATTRIASAAPILPGSSIPDPAIAGNAAYSQALLIYLLPHSLVTVSIATALFTGLSASAQAGRMGEVRAQLSRGLRTVSVFTMLATAVLVVLALPLTRLLVPTISDVAAEAVARVLVTMSLGLVPLGAMVLMKWAFFAFEDGKTVFLIQVPMTLVLVGGSLTTMWLAPQQWWVVGIGASVAASNAAAVALRAGALSRKIGGLDGHRVVRLHVRAFLAAVVAGLAGWFVVRLFGDLAGLSWARAALVSAAGGAVITGVYVLALTLMRVQEMRTLVGAVARVARRRRR